MKTNQPDTPKTHTRSGHVTREKEYRGDGLAKTGGYSVDKKPNIDPRVSSPSQTKEEPEPGSQTRVQ